MTSPLLRDPPSGWVNGAPVLQTELSALDAALARTVNGEGGGSYVQSATPTVIAGAGIVLAASLDHEITGAGSTIHPASGKAITHADGDYTALAAGHTGRFRSIVTAVERAAFLAGWTSENATGTLVSRTAGAQCMLRLRVHDRATLSSAALYFHVDAAHGPPAGLPKARILRVEAATGKATPLAAGGDGFTSYSPRPLSDTDWYASGAIKVLSLSLTPATIDVSRYAYFAQIVDERGSGAAAGNHYADVVCSFTDILDLGPQ